MKIPDYINHLTAYKPGKPIEETGAKTPHEGVEVHMRLLFGGGEPTTMVPSGQFHAINKQGELKSGPINQRPDVP